jgi:putative addiction module component (TIGR02574 family)
MANAVEKLFEEAMKLGSDERLVLADELLASVEASPPLREEWRAEIHRRLADLRSGRDSGLTYDEFFAD